MIGRGRDIVSSYFFKRKQNVYSNKMLAFLMMKEYNRGKIRYKKIPGGDQDETGSFKS